MIWQSTQCLQADANSHGVKKGQRKSTRSVDAIVDSLGDSAHAMTERTRRTAAASSAALHYEAAFERHYSVEELTELWGMSDDFVRRLFLHEPGVVTQSTVYSKSD